MHKRLHLIIKGRVQGVFYRDSTKKKAQELDIKGLVRNLREGNVEIIAEGEETKLNDLIQWCWKGPENARVSDIKIEWQPYKRQFKEFRVSY